MQFSIEKYISNFVQNQFPQFYQEEGPDFILFMKAYYEWMEETGNPIRESRTLFDYRDIDNTIESFLEFFQKKYLYGIPFNVIANKRFLLKHILDVYRSKGSIQCYKLLFKLLYNQDIEVYLPGRDILRASDGIWIEPKYLEVTYTDVLKEYIGKTIIGVFSGTTAVVENFVKENYNNDIINILYITNILPRGGSFEIGEKLVLLGEELNSDKISEAPNVLGSLQSLDIINGGQNFAIGDLIKIAYRDVSNGDVISYGVEGLLKVTELSRGSGSIFFDLQNGGFGYRDDALTFTYRNDSTGSGASFDVGSISTTETIEYNTDLICDYYDTTLDAATFGFPLEGTANVTSNLDVMFSYTNSIFGTISSLTNITTGDAYTQPANVFVRSVQISYPLEGTITYNTTSNTVTGSGTIFDSIYEADDVIYLQANATLNATIEYQVIKEVTNSTQIILYGPPTNNSTASAVYRASPTILPSNFAYYEDTVYQEDNSIAGENEYIRAFPSTGNNIVSKTVVVNSGKGYVEGETVKAYLFGAVSNNITIITGGSAYTNGDVMVFGGGTPGTVATGYVSTNSTGGVVNTTLTFAGSGYVSPPNIRIKTTTGSGAVLTAALEEFNTTSEIVGRVLKTSVGKARGYWETTRGFLNSDKYIQDSYYYQDFSYEIKVAQILNKYKTIIYDTFHPSGSELFGKYLDIVIESSENEILYENTEASIS